MTTQRYKKSEVEWIHHNRRNHLYKKGWDHQDFADALCGSTFLFPDDEPTYRSPSSEGFNSPSGDCKRCLAMLKKMED